MATYKTLVNGKEIPSKFGNPLFDLFLTQTVTAKLLDYAEVVNKTLSKGLEKGMKKEDKIVCQADDKVIFETTRGEAIKYASHVLTFKAAFEAYDKANKDMRKNAPAKLADMPKNSKGEAKTTEDYI